MSQILREEAIIDSLRRLAEAERDIRDLRERVGVVSEFACTLRLQVQRLCALPAGSLVEASDDE